MPSAGTLKRISRIRRRAIPAVRQAYENGLISAKRADLLLYKSHSEQTAQLAELLAEQSDRERRHKLAAETIASYLARLDGKPVDLQQVARSLQAVLN